jgi:hypothetical protein
LCQLAVQLAPVLAEEFFILTFFGSVLLVRQANFILISIKFSIFYT